jgi:cobalt/nickel transport protein
MAVLSGDGVASERGSTVGHEKTGQHKKYYEKITPTAVLAGSLMAAPAQAHFQELIPSTDIISDTTGKTITLDMVFTHPFAGGPVMDMGTAVQFGVLAGGRKQDLSRR